MKARIAERVSNSVSKVPRAFASYLGKKTAGLGSREKLVFLAGVCTVFGGLSLFYVIRVFSPGTKVKPVMPQQVAVPKHFDKTGEPAENEVVVVSPGLYRRLQEFKRFMDSLRQKADPAYDSIMRERPGLMDSVLWLEKIYSEQKP